jgi:hypothetical protein
MPPPYSVQKKKSLKKCYPKCHNASGSEDLSTRFISEHLADDSDLIHRYQISGIVGFGAAKIRIWRTPTAERKMKAGDD